MREAEKPLRQVLDANRRFANPRNPKSKREEFFIVVDDMMQKQEQWMKQGGGSGFMYAAHEAEKMVDKWLTKYEEDKAAEKRRAIEEIQKQQPTLF